MTVASTDAADRHRAHAAWDELIDTMIDFGVPLVPSESPRVTPARLVKRFHLDREAATRSGTAEAPTAGDSARLLGYAEERARYARTALPATGLADALHAVRRALAGQAYPATRVRAVLLPPSTLGRWRGRVRDTTTSAISLMYRLGDLLARLSPRRLLRSS